MLNIVIDFPYCTLVQCPPLFHDMDYFRLMDPNFAIVLETNTCGFDIIEIRNPTSGIRLTSTKFETHLAQNDMGRLLELNNPYLFHVM